MSFSAPTGPRVVYYVATGRQGGAFEVTGLPEQSPLFKVRAEAEKWLRAELAKIPEGLRPKTRSCLTCGRPFDSEGAHNRMCPQCRAHSSALATPVSLPNRTGRSR